MAFVHGLLQLLQMLKTVSIDESKRGLKLVIIYGVINTILRVYGSYCLAFSIMCFA